MYSDIDLAATQCCVQQSVAIDKLAFAAGNACITDKGLASLAAASSDMLQQLQEFALEAVQCTWEGVQLLLKQCPGLQKLNLYGIHPCL